MWTVVFRGDMVDGCRDAVGGVVGTRDIVVAERLIGVVRLMKFERRVGLERSLCLL